MRDPNPTDLYFPPFLGKHLASLSEKKDVLGEKKCVFRFLTRSQEV